MKVLKLIVVVAGLGCVGIFAFYSINEAYIYFTRSDARESNDAKKEFLMACAELGVNPSSFQGPTRPNKLLDESRNSYVFEWTRRPDEVIAVGISYWPYDIGYSASQGLVERLHRKSTSPTSATPARGIL